MPTKTQIGLILILHSVFLLSCGTNQDQIWLIDCKPGEEESCGYKNASGELTIDYGKYLMVFTDTFRNYAIVLDEEEGFIGIDKKEKTLFEVFPFDNGPDYVEDGYFRIIKDGKIGFVDFESGEIKIAPSFAAARPFTHGYAAVCPDCVLEQDGEYRRWVGGQWGIIDKEGRMVLPAEYDEIKTIHKNGVVIVLDGRLEKMIELK